MTRTISRYLAIIAALALAALASAVTGAAHAQNIDWNGARREGDLADRANIARPANQPMSALANVNVPVLLPALPGTVLTRQGGDSGLMFFPRGNLYTASFHYGGVDVSVSGAAGTAPANTPDEWTRTESGQSLNFSRFGAAYVIEVRCPDPSVGGNCTSEGFIRHIHGHLVVAGGSGL
ncbi:MAG: hypothetical protein ACK4NO_07585 [Glycocaulis sp.]